MIKPKCTICNQSIEEDDCIKCIDCKDLVCGQCSEETTEDERACTTCIWHHYEDCEVCKKPTPLETKRCCTVCLNSGCKECFEEGCTNCGNVHLKGVL